MVNTTAKMTAGKWAMITGVFIDQFTRIVYLNGGNAVSQNVNGGTLSNVKNVCWGTTYGWTSFQQSFPGYVGGAIVLPYAASAAQVSKLYQRPWAMFERRRPEGVAVAAPAASPVPIIIGGGVGNFIGC